MTAQPHDAQPPQDVQQLTDVASLKAIAHPLRVRLLGALRVDGPATATALARRLGESSGATSYHLRQLARFGFVEEDPEQPNQRDRRWRATHRYTAWRDSDVAASPEGREALGWLRRRQIDNTLRHLDEFERTRDDWSTDWQDSAGQHDDVVRLTPAALRELSGEVTRLIEEYGRRSADDPDAERVAILLSAVPVRDWLPGGDR